MHHETGAYCSFSHVRSMKKTVIALNVAEKEGEGRGGKYAKQRPFLMPPRRLDENISSCFSARVLLQTEQKPFPIRHSKPEIKPPLLSLVTRREAHALVKLRPLSCPLLVET